VLVKKPWTDTEKTPPIPGAPDAPRSVTLDRAQAAALVILGLIVLSALAGFVDGREQERRSAVGGLDVRVTHATRSRLLQTETLSVVVSNRSAAPADSVSVAIDSAYLSNFVETEITPQSAIPYTAQLVTVAPGAQREVRVTARAARVGRHRGAVRIAAHGDTVAVPLSTFILP
jgi:hypothetical protein